MDRWWPFLAAIFISINRTKPLLELGIDFSNVYEIWEKSLSYIVHKRGHIVGQADYCGAPVNSFQTIAIMWCQTKSTILYLRVFLVKETDRCKIL